MKRLVLFVLVICLILGTPVSAGMKTHWLKKPGKYSISIMGSKKQFKDQLSWSNLSKKQKKKALKLYNKNPKKLYKKYNKKIGLCRVFKIKLKKNTLTLWGRLKYKGNGKKKKYKFGKYKLKLSNNLIGKYIQAYNVKTSGAKKARKYLKNGYGLTYNLYISGGKVYKMECSS